MITHDPDDMIISGREWKREHAGRGRRSLGNIIISGRSLLYRRSALPPPHCRHDKGSVVGGELSLSMKIVVLYDPDTLVQG